jgi:hypothetical protein
MTDRLKAVLVTFDKDYRDDDAEAILTSIKMTKGVASVDPVPTDIGDFTARMSARMELEKKLWAVLHPEEEKK